MLKHFADRRRRYRPQEWIGLLVSYGLLAFYTLLSIYPFLWMVSAAFKSNTEVYQSQSLIPSEVHIDTFVDTWNRLDFFSHFGNSLFLTLLVVGGVLLIYSLAGYGFAVLPFRGRRALFVFFLSMMLVPGVTVLIPLYVMLRLQVPLIGPKAGFVSTFIGIALPMINGAAPFAIFLFRNYFRSIPMDLHDAAKVDGCSEFRIYWRIYLPLSVPALATIGMINFLGAWNAYVWPSIVLNKPEWMTLPLKLRELDLQQVTQWNVRMGGSLVTIIPVVVVFLFLQRYYIRGLTEGAVKS
jgi:ABC-type glycerol-3-phosphate transport system permease component